MSPNDTTTTTTQEAAEIILEQVDLDAAGIPVGAVLAWLEDNHYAPEQAGEHMDDISFAYRGEWENLNEWAWAELEENGLHDLPEWVNRQAVVSAWLDSAIQGGEVTTFPATDGRHIYVFTY